MGDHFTYNMITPTLLWILILVSSFSCNGVASLNCLECTDVFKPYFCDIVTQCEAGEECFVDQYVTSSGHVLYTSGCRSSQRCGAAKRNVITRGGIIDFRSNNTNINEDQSSDIIVCSECCTNADFCNLDGCGQTSIARASRGPLCFDCAKQGRHSCRHITQCDINYSCEIATEVQSGITLYNSRCVHTLSSANCNAQSKRSMTSFTEKRDQSTVGYCPKCCDDDFCNADCSEQPVVNGGWSVWGAWTGCSATCGSGTHRRTRTCSHPTPSGGGQSCVGDASETGHCTAIVAHCPVDGGFSHWLPWGQCDATCGSTGTQTRSRLCNKPEPAYGGAGCVGHSTDSRACPNLPLCVDPNGGYGDWSPWSACPRTCGGTGSQYRHRSCLHSPCTGDASSTRACSYQSHCPVNGGFSAWGPWSACSNTCGKHGQHTRSRTCTHPAPAHGGTTCVGKYQDTQDCQETSAEFSCMPASNHYYIVWSAWSQCSKSCGSGGRQHRSKTCYDSNHHRNQSLCTQPVYQQIYCSLGDCPTVNGSWSAWNRWGHCSTSCERGYQSRHRYCTNPRPEGDGLDCVGDSLERKVCDNTGSCSDSGYSSWSSWGKCSSDCGVGGFKSRFRVCLHGHSGAGDCRGQTTEHVPCNNNVTCTPVDGGWSSWGHWSACTSSCGTGHHRRTRGCTHPSPQHGGKNCLGPSFETANCSSNCPESDCESTLGYHLYTYNTHVSATSHGTAFLCIHFSTTAKTWSQASMKCRREGGHLVVFDTWESDRAAVTSHIHTAYPRIPNTKVWIGLTHSRGAWHWDTTSGVGFYARQKLGSNFYVLPAEFPNGACVLDDGTNWELANCSEPHYYMCEKKV